MKCDICDRPIKLRSRNSEPVHGLAGTKARTTARIGVEMCPDCFDEDVAQRQARRRSGEAPRPTLRLLALARPQRPAPALKPAKPRALSERDYAGLLEPSQRERGAVFTAPILRGEARVATEPRVIYLAPDALEDAEEARAMAQADGEGRESVGTFWDGMGPGD